MEANGRKSDENCLLLGQDNDTVTCNAEESPEDSFLIRIHVKDVDVVKDKSVNSDAGCSCRTPPWFVVTLSFVQVTVDICVFMGSCMLAYELKCYIYSTSHLLCIKIY